MNTTPAARAAIMEYEAASGLRVAEPTPVASDTPPIPEHALALYPWLARYQHTARIEFHVCNETGHVYRFVTVTIKRQPRHAAESRMR